MIEFSEAESFYIRGRGQVFSVLLDQETYDFSHLIGQKVRINGNQYTCTGVDHFAHTPPWRLGERIGILVKSKETPNLAFAVGKDE